MSKRDRDGYLGGIAYALRLLNSPRLKPDGAPINLLAAQGVLEAMLGGDAASYASMADSHGQRRADGRAGMIWPETRTSYTLVRGARGHYYRAAIRRRSDDGVIWECNHQHELPSETLACAQQQMRAAASR